MNGIPKYAAVPDGHYTDWEIIYVGTGDSEKEAIGNFCIDHLEDYMDHTGYTGNFIDVTVWTTITPEDSEWEDPPGHWDWVLHKLIDTQPVSCERL